MSISNRAWDDLVALREQGDPRPDVLTADSALHAVSCPACHASEYRFVVVDPDSFPQPAIASVADWHGWMREACVEGPCGRCASPMRTDSLRAASWLPLARRDLLLSFEGGRLHAALRSRRGWTVVVPLDHPALAEIAPACATRRAVLTLDATLEERVQALADVLRRHPEYAPALRERARCERLRQRFVEARQYAEQAVGQTPHDAESWFVLGDVLDESDALDDALFAYRCSVALDPHNAEAHNQHGMVLRRLGRGEEALLAYRRALECVPRHAAALNNIARIERDRDNPDGIVAALELVRPEDVDDGDAVLRTSLCQLSSTAGEDFAAFGRWDFARRCYALATRFDGTRPAAWYNLACCHANLGRWQDAIAAARRTLALEPTCPGAQRILDSCRART